MALRFRSQRVGETTKKVIIEDDSKEKKIIELEEEIVKLNKYVDSIDPIISKLNELLKDHEEDISSTVREIKKMVNLHEEEISILKKKVNFEKLNFHLRYL